MEERGDGVSNQNSNQRAKELGRAGGPNRKAHHHGKCADGGRERRTVCSLCAAVCSNSTPAAIFPSSNPTAIMTTPDTTAGNSFRVRLTTAPHQQEAARPPEQFGRNAGTRNPRRVFEPMSAIGIKRTSQCAR